ncbi:MAG: hypothetical protein WBZ29_07225 [Methanocella sp.]
MAKSSKKKTAYKTKRIGKYRVVMTDRVKLLLIASFMFGFLVICFIFIQLALSQ